MPDFDIRLNLTPALDVRSLNAMIRALKGSLGQFGKDIKLIDERSLQDELSKLRKQYQDTVKNLPQQHFPIPIPDVPDLPGTTAAAFKFNQVYDAVRNVAEVVGTLSRPFVELDTQVKNIGTLGVKNFEEFSSLALDLSKKVPDSAANIAAGAYDAISAGITGTNEQIMKFVETAARVGVAGVSDTKSAVNGLTSIMNAYGKSVDQVGQVSNVFFAGIKLGKTTFAELNQSLANVIPAASAAGISFEQVIAMIAQMTSLGVPTAQATTQIRQAIIELQKPGTDLAAIMAQVGLDAGNVGKALKEQGLLSVLQQVEGAATKSGKSLTQVFSSSEAASAALLVTGQNAKRAVDTLNGVIDEAASGVGDKAYEVAATGIEARTKVMINKIQAGIAKVFDTLGSGFTSVLGAASQLAPTLASVVNLKSIIPPSAITRVSGLVSGNLLPSLAKIAPALFTANAAGATSFVGLGTAAKAAWAAVTGPVGLVIAAIGLVVAAVTYWLTKTKEGQRVWNYITTAVQQFWDTVKPVLEQLGSILSSVGELVFEFLVTPFQIYNDLVMETVMAIADFVAEMVGASNGAELFAMIMAKVTKFLTIAKAAIRGTVEALKTFKGGIGEVLKAALSGDPVGAAKAALDLGKNVGKSYSNGVKKSLDEKAIEGMTDALSETKDIKLKIDANVEIGNVTADYEKAQQEVERITSQLLSARQSGADNATVANLEAQLGAAQGKADNLAQTLAEKVPSSVTGMRQVIDATGRLKTVYDVNVDAVKQFAAANDKAYGNQLLQKQKKFETGLQAQQRQIAENEKQMKKLSDEIVAGVASGKDVSKQQADYKKLADETNTARQNMRKAFEEAAAAGLVTDDNIQRIAKDMGISVDEAKQLVTKQKELTAESGKAAASVSDLAKAFNDAKKKASDAFEEGKAALSEEARLHGRNSKEYRTRLAQVQKLAKENRNMQRYSDQTEALFKDRDIVAEKKKQLDIEKQLLDDEAKLFDLSLSRAATEQGRQRNAEDDLLLQKKQLESAKTYLAAVQGKFTSEVMVNLSVDKRREAQRIVTDAQFAVDEAETKIDAAQLQLNVDKDALAKQFREFQFSELQIAVELKFAKEEDVRAELNKDLSAVNIQLLMANVSEEKRLELLREQQRLQGEIRSTNERIYQREKTAIEERLQRSKAVTDKLMANELRLAEIARKAQEKYGTAVVDKQANDRIKKLDDLHKKELISDEEYEKRKTAIEEAAQKQRDIIARRTEGSRIVDDRIQALKALADEKTQLEALLNASGLRQDSPEATAMRRRLDEVNRAITEKGDILTDSFSILGDGITEGMTGLFEGDPEALKNSLRASFAVIAGAIEKQMQLFALRLILSEGTVKTLEALPFPLNILSIPIITAAVNGAVSSLVRPILSSVMSFASGGRVDSPTLAVVGDAAGAARNTEWIFRDADIVAMMASVIEGSNKPVVEALRRVEAKLDVIASTQTVLRGQDIYISHGRVSAAQSSRERT